MITVLVESRVGDSSDVLLTFVDNVNFDLATGDPTASGELINSLGEPVDDVGTLLSRELNPFS